MLYPVYLIKDACTRLTALNAIVEKNLKTPEKFNTVDVMPKISNAMNDALTGTSEMQFCFSSNEYRMMARIVSNSAGVIENTENISLDLLSNQLKQIIELLDGVDEHMNEDHYRWRFARNFAPNKTNPTVYSRSFYSKLSEKLACCNRNVNVLLMRDNNGGQAKEMRETAGSLKAVYYGIGMPESISSYVRDYFDHVALGSMRGGSATNNAFDIVVCSPIAKISIDSTKANIEKTALMDDVRDTLKYLRLGGYLVMGIPYFRFSRDISAYLARTFEDIQLLRPEELDDETGFVYFIGRKKDRSKDIAASNDVSGNISFHLMRRLSHDIDAASLIADMQSITLSINEIPIISFTGSVLDAREQYSIVERSSASVQFWANAREKVHSTSDKHPPLPFGLGQIALVTCSGCMDGVIEEGNDCCHLVKGRVVKCSEITQSEDGEVTKISKIESNRVEINILTPDGELKKLA